MTCAHCDCPVSCVFCAAPLSMRDGAYRSSDGMEKCPQIPRTWKDVPNHVPLHDSFDPVISNRSKQVYRQHGVEAL